MIYLCLQQFSSWSRIFCYSLLVLRHKLGECLMSLWCPIYTLSVREVLKGTSSYFQSPSKEQSSATQCVLCYHLLPHICICRWTEHQLMLSTNNSSVNMVHFLLTWGFQKSFQVAISKRGTSLYQSFSTWYCIGRCCARSQLFVFFHITTIILIILWISNNTTYT